MAGRQAKILSDRDVARVLAALARHRQATRNRAMLLLSVKAGLRACEIARLTWPMLLDARGCVGRAIELADTAAKKRSGRCIPLHPELRAALIALRRKSVREAGGASGPVVCSERGAALTPGSVVNWFASTYRVAGLQNCSSHSGRRTFITQAARRVHKAGGSLRDVQQLAGHRSIEMTQRYIDADAAAQRRLVALL